MSPQPVRKPQPIDISVGEKIKARRLLLNKTQEDLAKALGITFQQVQKYERGTNRITLGRLVNICDALEVSPAYFFDDDTLKKKIEASRKKSPPDQAAEIMEIAHSFLRIRDRHIRAHLLELVRRLSVKN